MLTASDGRLWSRHDYHPFGTEIEDGAEILQDGFESGDARYWLESKDEQRYEFTGHERDPSGITDYMLARTYLYPFYRFSSVDRARDGWNLYTYVGNNPVGYTDPTGELSQDAKEGISIVLSLTPGVSAFKDGQEVVLGIDLITGEKLTTGERVITAISILIPVVGAVVIRKGLKAVSKAGQAQKQRGKLQKLAAEIREGGSEQARNRRVIAVGEDADGALHAGSSNGFDAGQRAAADRLGIQRVPSRRGAHAEEDLLREVPGLKRVGTSRRSPCGPGEHNCAGQLRAAGVEIDNID